MEKALYPQPAVQDGCGILLSGASPKAPRPGQVRSESCRAEALRGIGNSRPAVSITGNIKGASLIGKFELEVTRDLILDFKQYLLLRLQNHLSISLLDKRQPLQPSSALVKVQLRNHFNHLLSKNQL